MVGKSADGLYFKNTAHPIKRHINNNNMKNNHKDHNNNNNNKLTLGNNVLSNPKTKFQKSLCSQSKFIFHIV